MLSCKVCGVNSEVGTKLPQEIRQRGLSSAHPSLTIAFLNRVLSPIMLLSLNFVRLEHLLQGDLGPHLLPPLGLLLARVVWIRPLKIDLRAALLLRVRAPIERSWKPVLINFRLLLVHPPNLVVENVARSKLLNGIL